MFIYKFSDIDEILTDMIDNEHADTFVGGLEDSVVDLGVGILDLVWDLIFPDNLKDMIQSVLVVGAAVGIGFAIAAGGWVVVAIAAGVGLALTTAMVIDIHNQGHGWDYAIGYGVPHFLMDVLTLGEASGMRTVSKAGAVTKRYSNIASEVDTIRPVGPGKTYHKDQTDLIKAENRKRNGGELRSDGNGKRVYDSKNGKAGTEYLYKDRAAVDHIVPKSKGGENSAGNAQILSTSENSSKNNKIVSTVTKDFADTVNKVEKPLISTEVGIDLDKIEELLKGD